MCDMVSVGLAGLVCDMVSVGLAWCVIWSV